MKSEKEIKSTDVSKSTSAGTKVSNENGDDKSSIKVADKEDAKSGKKDDRLVLQTDAIYLGPSSTKQI